MMNRSKRRQRTNNQSKPSTVDERGERSLNERLDDKLDDALADTFPASDPVALTAPAEPDREPGYASPPCSMHDTDPSYHGYWTRQQTLDFLNRMLEGERAGAQALAELSRQAPEARSHDLFRDIAQDEAQCCAMLTRQITRLGGTPSRETGSFYDKLVGAKKTGERVELLDRGQAWVVRKLREALPKVGDGALHRDLTEMLEVHERNIRRCSALR